MPAAFLGHPRVLVLVHRTVTPANADDSSSRVRHPQRRCRCWSLSTEVFDFRPSPILRVLRCLVGSHMRAYIHCWLSPRVFLQVITKFPDALHSAIGGLLFLRFFCPAIVSPESFGLLRKHIRPELRRLAILVSKVLQSLSNRSPLKESYLQFTAAFCKEKTPLLAVGVLLC
jgi:GTPase-activator protein for Ras-like GTPase